jgi:uridylate kinase
MDNDLPRYRRILLKLSGEALMGERSFGLEPAVLQGVSEEIHGLAREGVEIGIVIGGGNLFRGLNAEAYGIPRVPADHMGMLATVINAIALGEAVRRAGSQVRVLSALEISGVVEPYGTAGANHHLAAGRVVVFCGGTGNPYFSTDTAAALRALEIGAEVLLKATKVDGVFDADPVKNPGLRPYEALTYGQVLSKRLAVMDLTAITMARGENLPIVVFNLRKKGNIKRVGLGEPVGTIITGDGG